MSNEKTCPNCSGGESECIQCQNSPTPLSAEETLNKLFDKIPAPEKDGYYHMSKDDITRFVKQFNDQQTAQLRQQLQQQIEATEFMKETCDNYEKELTALKEMNEKMQIEITESYNKGVTDVLSIVANTFVSEESAEKIENKLLNK